MLFRALLALACIGLSGCSPKPDIDDTRPVLIIGESTFFPAKTTNGVYGVTTTYVLGYKGPNGYVEIGRLTPETPKP
jgi:hypothetical protein